MAYTIAEALQHFETLSEETTIGKAAKAIRENNSSALAALIKDDPSLQNYRVEAIIDSEESSHIRVIRVYLENYADYIGSGACYAQLIGVGPNHNPWRMTRAHWAAAKGDTETIRKINDEKCFIDLEINMGLSPLDFAAMNGHPDCVEYLLDAGVEVNQVDSFNETPLHRAAENGHLDCLIKLLRHGANADVTNNAGRTPLYVSTINKHASCVKTLLLFGATPNTEELLEISARNGDVESFKTLLYCAPLRDTSPDQKLEAFNLLPEEKRTECGELVKKTIAIQRYAAEGKVRVLQRVCGAIHSLMSISLAQITLFNVLEQTVREQEPELYEAFRFVCKNILENPHQELSTEPTVDSKDRSGGASAASVSAAEEPRVTAAFTPGAAFATGATRLAAAAPTTSPPPAAEPTLPGVVPHAGGATAGRGR